MHCPKCGQFVKGVMFNENHDHDILAVWGYCKKHGKVDLFHEPWDHESLHGSEEECEQQRVIHSKT